MHAAIFESERPRLLRLAYRMLGCYTQAHDIVQDAWVRLAGNECAPENPPGYLTTVVTRLCLGELRTARHRLESYPGLWLPEPVADPTLVDGPESTAERSETLSIAFLSAMEVLTPMERAVFVLHEVFDHSHAEIGVILDTSEPACRQSLRRARRAIRGGILPAAPAEHTRRLLAAFLDACRAGDITRLLALLVDDVVARADGGGNVTAATVPVIGSHAVSRLYKGIFAREPAGLRFTIEQVNGQPSLLARFGAHVFSMLQIQLRDGRIARIDVQCNPEKLRTLSTQL
jgi:RNA polymerase sigma-70 factor (ECF subfamily)